MTVEDFLLYTEEDPLSNISKTSTRITFADLRRGTVAHVHYDKGDAYFDGDFEILLTVRLSEAQSEALEFGWALTNDVANFKAIADANKSAFGLRWYHTGVKLNLEGIELDDGYEYSAIEAYEISTNTTYYLKIVRDESVGAYGTLYFYIYSDPDRNNLLATMTATLHSPKKDFRHLFGLESHADGGTQESSGYIENLEIISPVPKETPEAMGLNRGFDFRGMGFRV